MTSNNAKSPKNVPPTRRVVFIVYPDFVLLDLSGPLQVFTHARCPTTQSSSSKYNAYDTAIASVHGGSVVSNTIVSIDSLPISSLVGQEIHTLIVVGGDGAYDSMHDEALLDGISRLAQSAQRVCSVCSGALILAATGMLDGRRAVTHWEDCKQLQEAFPNVQVEVDPIYIKDGRFWTSAGITAGIDMALAVVAEDLGRVSALEMARSLVAPMVRSGGQSQFSPTLNQQTTDVAGRFDELHQWIANNLTSDLRVEALAERVNMSPRNFSRLYTSHMKVTPAKAVESIRIQAAREWLETTTLGVKEIANRCGFNDAERMRRAFIRSVKTSPTDYRSHFHSD